MLGLEGVAVPLGFILTILSTILCIIYGILNWNKGYVTNEKMQPREEQNETTLMCKKRYDLSSHTK